MKHLVVFCFLLLRHLNIIFCHVFYYFNAVLSFLGILDIVDKKETSERSEAGAELLYGSVFF